MGAVYAVSLKLRYDNEAKVIEKMNEYIGLHDGKDVDFRLADYAKKGISRNSIKDLVQILISDNGFEDLGDGEYEASFDASYGWERVMTEMFESIAGVLSDGSMLEIFPDESHEKLTVKNGKAVW